MSISIDKKISIDERNELIEYINEHIDELSYKSKKNVLHMIINNVPDDKIKEKGTGTQIQYDDIPNDLLIILYNHIFSNMTSVAYSM